MANCPDSWEKMRVYAIRNGNYYTEDQLVLFTQYDKDDTAQQEINNSNFAVLDSACSSTVCGENWFNNYLESLGRCDKRKVKHNVSRKTFKFGGGNKLKSKGEYWLPAVIAGKEVAIKIDVIKSDILLLLSQRAMKTTGIELEKDAAKIFRKD